MTTARERSAGILLHPTSLPGPHGIGDLGPGAHEFVRFLAEAGMTRWQILPLGPPGYGGSPYNAESSFAGNEWLVSPELLAEDGLLTPDEIADRPAFEANHVDFGAVAAHKEPLFRRAFERFRRGQPDPRFDAFRERAASWLDDFALFRALKRLYDDRPWDTWDAPFGLRDLDGLARARRDLAEDVEFECFIQWMFERQWEALRAKAHDNGILIVGDVPMFPAYDSADVWANQDLFKLDADGQPTVIAGVPPDYFSDTGQLWGNPHYDWPRHIEQDYRWWRERFRWTFHRTDIVRIDHFRGFQAAWEVPADAETAVNGEWVEGPGLDFFRDLDLLNQGAIIAEDLGTITDAVRQLLADTGFPGMKALHFAFGSKADNPYLPHNHVQNSVVYTGTHDNDTTVGWLDSLDAKTRSHLEEYLGPAASELPDALIRTVFASVGDTAVIPMQDVLLLGTEHRMNTPSEPEGSWTWRFQWDQLQPGRTPWLRNLVELYGRSPVEEEEGTGEERDGASAEG